MSDRGRLDIPWRRIYRGGRATRPDHEVAARWGVSRTTVRRHRQELGVPPYDERRAQADVDWDAVDWDAYRSVSAVARALGVSAQAAHQARARRLASAVTPPDEQPDN